MAEGEKAALLRALEAAKKRQEQDREGQGAGSEEEEEGD